MRPRYVLRPGAPLVVLGACLYQGGCSLVVDTSSLQDGPASASAVSVGAGAAGGGGTGTGTGGTGGGGAGAGAGGGGVAGGGGIPEVDPSLLAAWTFDDIDANIAEDVTGHGHGAVLTRGAAFSADGHTGGALVVQGGGYAFAESLDGPAFPATGTLSIWFKYDSLPLDSSLGIFDNFDLTRGHVYLRHRDGAPEGEFQLAVQPADATGYCFAENFLVPPLTWAHVVLTWDDAAQSAAAYLNGQLLAEEEYSKPCTVDGERVRFGQNFEGWIDEVRVYDRVLSAIEAAELP